jgi:hypothetical protein
MARERSKGYKEDIVTENNRRMWIEKIPITANGQ